jgi:hypothetical protein
MRWFTRRYSKGYANNQYRAVQQFCRWLAEEEGVPDPMLGMKPPKTGEGLVPVVSNQEMAALIKNAEKSRAPKYATKKALKAYVFSLVKVDNTSVLTRHTLELFLTACGLDEPARQPWLDAWTRVTTADQRRPSGAVRVRDADPRRLGVHASIQVDPLATDLPTYVPRDLDLELHTPLTAARDHGGGFVLLVGGSSVGKTHALVEAVPAVLGEWWLTHTDPTDPAALADLAAAPPLRTVIWLDELQRYLTDPGRLSAGRARALMAAGGMLVATLWPNEYHAPVQQAPDPPDRDLLGLAHIITVPDQFSVNERAHAQTLTGGDARLRTALGNPDAGVIQVLAAGPELVRRWETADAPYGTASSSPPEPVDTP